MSVDRSTLLSVPVDQSIIVMPLLSNAKAMLTGSSIGALRNRLKFASVFYDVVALEAGAAEITAGSQMSTRFRWPPGTHGAETIRWQTPARRGAAQRGPFAIGLGREQTPGVPAEQIDIAMTSDTSIRWEATFEPFRAELPVGCDWIQYYVLSTRDPARIDRLAKQSANADGANPALERALPVDFARKMVIENANHDLALISTAQPSMSASLDPLHTQVVAQRLASDSGWHANGYAVPILFPRVSSLTWEQIAELRRDRAIAQFRAVMNELEHECLAEAAAGDAEAAVKHAYDKHRDELLKPADAVLKAIGRSAIFISVSLGASISTLGLAPAISLPIGAGVAAITATPDIVKIRRTNRRRAWLSVAQRLS